jgi:hypothetical protein
MRESIVLCNSCNEIVSRREFKVEEKKCTACFQAESLHEYGNPYGERANNVIKTLNRNNNLLKSLFEGNELYKIISSNVDVCLLYLQENERRRPFAKNKAGDYYYINCLVYYGCWPPQ